MKIIIMSSAVFYLTAALFHTLNKQKIGYIFHGAGVAANLYLVIYNWVTNGYVPFISMYQVLTFVGVCFTLGCLYMHFVNKDKWMDKYFLLCSGILMIGVFFMQTTDIWYRPPALQSIWFIPHIMCYMIGYPLCAVSFVLCIMRLCSPQVKESHDKDTREKILRIREMRDKGIYDVVRFAFPFMTAGMLLGAIWANEIWSHYWSWDPKENWALITWLLYAIYLHCYRSKSMRKYMYIFIILGIIALIVTMFGINILTKVLGDLGSEHAYS